MPVDIAAVLTANIDEFKAKMAEADVTMKKMTDSGSSNFSKLSSIGKGAALGLGAAVIGVGVAAVNFGDKLETSQAQLEASLKAAGISWNSVKGNVDQTAESATRYGYTQAQVEAALSQGVISTQNYGEAHKILGVAISVAAAKHVDLQTAMMAVTKAAEGQSRPLKQLGIDLPIVQSSALKVQQAQDAVIVAQSKAHDLLIKYGPAVEDLGNKHYPQWEAATQKVSAAQHKLSEEQNAGGQILDALTHRLSGQAAAAAGTFGGKVAAIKAEGENLAAHIGTHLIPILERLVSVVMNVVTWLEHHKVVMEILGAAILAFVGTAMVAWIYSMVAAAAASIAAAAVPLLIVAAIAALGVAIFELVTHWKQVWTDIKNWLDDGYQFIKAHFYLLMAIPLVGWMLALAVNWKTIWDGIKTAISVAWSIIGPIFNLIKSAGIDVVQAAISVFRGIWSFVWSGVQTDIGAAKAVIDTVTAGIAFAIGGVEAVINGLTSIWNSVWGGLGGAVQAIWNFLSPIFSSIAGAINGVVGALHTLGGVVSTVMGVVGKAGGVVKNVLTLGGILGSGGPAQAGTPYIVGDTGPELFIPSASGVVVPPGGFGPGTGGTAIAAGGAQASSVVVNLVINGQTFAQAISNDMWTAFLQKKRSTVTLNLT